MQLFFRYLKTKAKAVFVYLFFAVLFAVSFLLYHLPIQAVLYPAALCTLFGIGFLLLDFFSVRTLHHKLCYLKKQTAELEGFLPKAGTLPEEDYRELVLSLQKEISEIKAEDEARYCDTVDYYTVWVHQIKTPLFSMKLALQNEDSAFSRCLSADLFRVEQYVGMVLAYLRLNSDTSDYLFAKYCLDDIIRPSMRKFAPDFIGRKLSLSYEPIKACVVTDEKWLSFVIEQLLSNALKYTPAGGISIFLKEEKSLVIKDTGIGIAPEDLPRIFEKGYTGYNGRTDRAATGLGLYLCRRICENLGVGISVQSEVGQGTEVSLDLSQYHLRAE